MKFRPSVHFYLALSLGLFILIFLGSATYFWYSHEEQLAEEALQIQLTHRAQLLATVSQADDTPEQFVQLPATYAALDSNLRIAYISTHDEIRTLSQSPLSDYQIRIVREMGRQALTGDVISREVYAGDNAEEVETLYAAAPVFDQNGKVVGAVCLVLSLEEFEDTMLQSRARLLLAEGGIALLSLLLGTVLATLLTQPLSRAQRLAAQVASGEYDLRLSERGPREFADLAHHLNEMAEELQKQRHGRELVLANMTHELARSLGGLRLGVDSLQGGALDDPTLAADLLVEMGQSLQRMEGLIEDLALAARPVAKPVQLNLAMISLEPMIHGLKSRFWPRAELRGIHLEVSLPDELPPVEADELRLHQILANLVDNAIKFTPSGGAVTLSAAAVDASIQLTVRDTGPGIPAKDLKHVLEPFTQGESEDRVRQGMGLGLSIVQQLTVAHGGQLKLKNAEGGGLLVFVTIPLRQSLRRDGR